MIKPELYHKTVGILYDAYFNDTLVHGDCCACAVGNIIARSNKYSIVDKEYCCGDWMGSRMFFDGELYRPPKWARVFCTITFGSQKKQVIEILRLNGEAKKQIDSTGYSWDELAKIEYAFEMADKGANTEDYMFNGLVAVLEILKEIHQVTDEDLLASNNNRFKDHYNRRIGATL